MAKFFESMLLALQFSVTLRKEKQNQYHQTLTSKNKTEYILDKVLEDEFEYVETDGCQFLCQEIP